jgi:hypothetical protein
MNPILFGQVVCYVLLALFVTCLVLQARDRRHNLREGKRLYEAGSFRIFPKSTGH